MTDRYKIKNMRAKNVAYGKKAKIDARVRAAPDWPLRAQALDQIEHLLELLTSQDGGAPETDSIQANAKALDGALKKKRLDRAHIEGCIQKITAGAAGVTALANAADAIHATIMRLFS